jgi:hypothetical protein
VSDAEPAALRAARLALAARFEGAETTAALRTEAVAAAVGTA